MKEFLNKKVKIRVSNPFNDFWLKKYNYGVLLEVKDDGSFIVKSEYMTLIYYNPDAWIVELNE